MQYYYLQYWNQPKEHLYRPKPPQSWIKTGPQNKTNGKFLLYVYNLYL